MNTLLRNLLITLGAAVVLLGLTYQLEPFRNYQLATVAAYLCATAGLTVLIGLNGQVSLGQTQGREIRPRGLLDTAEDDAHPHLARTVRVVPPPEQLAGPPGASLIDLDRLGLTGEHSCSVLHGA